MKTPRLLSLFFFLGVATLAHAARPTITISDTVWPEGNGQTDAYVTFTLSEPYAYDIGISPRIFQPAQINEYWANIHFDCGTCRIPAGETVAHMKLIIDGNESYQSLPREWQINVQYVDTSSGPYDNVSFMFTLTEDDPIPVVTADDVSVSEGTGGTNWVTLTLNASSRCTGTVAWRTIDETADSSDYFPGTLQYPAMQQPIRFGNQTSVDIGFAINGDTQIEGDESFLLELYDPHDLSLARTQFRVTILNDDNSTPPMVTVSDVTVLEGDNGFPNAELTFTADAPTNGSFQWVTVEGTAGFGDNDYQSSGGILSFNGSTTATLLIPIYGDTKVEPDEMFSIALSNPSNLQLSRTSVNITILNDDGTTVSFTPNNLVLFAGETASIDASLPSGVAGASMNVAVHATSPVISVPSSFDVPGTLTVQALFPGTASIECESPASCASLRIAVISPTLSRITPNVAATTGGTPMTIRGVGLSNGCSVMFGGVPATSTTSLDSQTLNVIAPAHEPGKTIVTVTCGAVTLTVPQFVEYVPGRRRSVGH
ncbi:MAG TPA: Calx-beta domain-containing protein [Thermoanaerobaculia bacterium]|nr:Calx-beta domain-containing protein [Thermoanaerobaculia bacterium]